MPDVFTPNLALIKPEVGASRDTWGSKTNTNWDVVDDVLAMAMPIGAILDFAGPTAPPGWLICDGRLVSRITYSALFSVVTTYWGAGDGSTNFALPPCPGRVSIGPGSVTGDAGEGASYFFSQRSGASYRPISQANLPNYAIGTDAQGGHNHGYWTINNGTHVHTMDGQGNHNHGYYTTTETAIHTHNGTTDGVGDHTHGVNAWATSGGGALASAGGVPTQGGVTTNPAGAHAHTFLTAGENQLHQHGINYDGNHAHNLNYGGDHVHGINYDGNHAHTIYLGGGGSWFDLRQPLIVVTKIIFAGQQASTRILTAAAAAPLRRLSAPLRGSH